MTFAEVMWRYLLANLAVNGVVAVVSGGVAALLVYLIMRDGRPAAGPAVLADGDQATASLPEPDGQQEWLEPILDEPVFAPGVAKVGQR